MSKKDFLEKLIEENPKARERKYKDDAIVHVLVTRFYHSFEEIDREKLIEFVKDHNTLDRSWRKILEERPELRGSDYNDKERLEQEKQIELGYESGGTQLLPVNLRV